MKNFFEKNFIFFGITAVCLLILISAVLTFYNKGIMQKAIDTKGRSEMVKKVSENTFGIIRKIDVSLRGYAIIREEQFLFYKIDEVRKDNQRDFDKLDSLLSLEGYHMMAKYEEAKKSVNQYIDHYEKMTNLLRENNMETFVVEMRKDPGAIVWNNFQDFSEQLHTHEDKLTAKANDDYYSASFRNLFVQVLLIIIGFPTLFLIVLKLKKQEAARKSLLLDVDNNNKRFLFNPGSQAEEGVELVLEKSIHNLEKASEFVTQMTQGNYEVKWEELNDQNIELNKENLVGKLILMREQMKKAKMEDEKRLWATEGLAELSEIIRNHQNNLNELSDKCLLFLVKYLKAQQGSLFILQEEEERESYLQLISCYAFDRKKFIKKEIALGEGIVGQTFLEAESVTMSRLPQGYVSIKSGLGDATPNALLVVPMKYNESVKAVVEFASFNIFKEHEILFVEKAGEFIASAVATVYNNEKTQKLLDGLKEQTEQMKSQEEELRQNMEELQATQEQMRRKELALDNGMGPEEQS
jgi:hypothetical protein